MTTGLKSGVAVSNPGPKVQFDPCVYDGSTRLAYDFTRPASNRQPAGALAVGASFFDMVTKTPIANIVGAGFSSLAGPKGLVFPGSGDTTRSLAYGSAGQYDRHALNHEFLFTVWASITMPLSTKPLVVHGAGANRNSEQIYIDTGADGLSPAVTVGGTLADGTTVTAKTLVGGTLAEASGTATTANGSDTITASTTPLVVGQYVLGAGIPAGTRVLVDNGGGSYKLSAQATASASGVAIKGHGGAHQIAVNWVPGTSMTMYVDGAQVATSTASVPATLYDASTAIMRSPDLWGGTLLRVLDEDLYLAKLIEPTVTAAQRVAFDYAATRAQLTALGIR